MDYNNLNVKLKPLKIRKFIHAIKSQANTHLIPKNK